MYIVMDNSLSVYVKAHSTYTLIIMININKINYREFYIPKSYLYCKYAHIILIYTSSKVLI